MKNNSLLVRELEYQLQEMKDKLRAKELVIMNLLEELDYLREEEIEVDIC